MKFLWPNAWSQAKDKGCEGIERKFFGEFITFAFFKFLGI